MAFRGRAATCLLLALLLTACETRHRLTPTAVATQQVSAEGSASIGAGGPALARREAIDAAISQASYEMKQSNNAETLISDIKVVDEWQENHTYNVQILAVLSAKQLCQTTYRKKIVATGFPIMNPDQLSSTESQDLFAGIPREINNRLMESGTFIGRNQTNTVLYSRPDMAPEIIPTGVYYGSSILNIARQQDAQFVLSGVIRDFKIESTEYTRGTGVLAEIKSLVRDMVGRRSIGIDVYVHDGFSGALLFQQRYTDSILGDFSLPAGYTVGSDRFNSTSAGHSIDNIIRMASEDIQRLFACYPYASRIAAVVGKQIVISAGAQEKIKVGDRFKVYSTIVSNNNVSIPTPQGVLTITDVNANSAQGKLDDDSQTFMIRPGDWVKSYTGQ